MPVKKAIEALYRPIEGIVKTLAGPAAEEIGLSFRDSIQAWRFQRQIRLFERVKKLCEDAGIKPRAVRLPFLFEVVDKATLEEDDNLQDRWANLLTNAADPNFKGLVTNAFPDILKQLSNDEALMLEDLYERGRVPSRSEIKEALRKRRETPEVTVNFVYEENLSRLGLTDEREPQPGSAGFYGAFFQQRRPLPSRKWSLTALGVALVEACKAPQKSSTNP